MQAESPVSKLPKIARALLSLAALLVSMAPAAAQSGGTPGFAPIGDYLVEIDGEDQVGAQIYGARAARSLLVMAAELPMPVLIDLASGSVSGVHLMKVSMRSDGSVDLLPNAVARSYGAYSIDGDRIVFDVEGHQVVVKPKPALTGTHTPAEIVAHDPAYGTKRDQYAPSAPLVEQLRQHDQEVRVRIYFGSWCPFCAEMVPRVLKVDEELRGSKIHFEYYGLPHNINEDANARALSIRGVPTGIVYVGGKEIGRISGNSWRSPEQALIDLLEG